MYYSRSPDNHGNNRGKNGHRGDLIMATPAAVEHKHMREINVPGNVAACGLAREMALREVIMLAPLIGNRRLSYAAAISAQI